VHANASRHNALSYGRASQLKEQFKAEVAELSRRAEETDTNEARAPLDIPAEQLHLRDRLRRLSRLTAASSARPIRRAFLPITVETSPWHMCPKKSSLALRSVMARRPHFVTIGSGSFCRKSCARFVRIDFDRGTTTPHEANSSRQLDERGHQEDAFARPRISASSNVAGHKRNAF
jgi:hypothetical protein